MSVAPQDSGAAMLPRVLAHARAQRRAAELPAGAGTMMGDNTVCLASVQDGASRGDNQL